MAPETKPEGEPKTKASKGTSGLTAEVLAAAAYGGKTATEASDLSPAQLAAATYELQKPRVSAKEAIWGTVDGDAGRSDVQNADPAIDYRIIETSRFAADGRELFAERQKLTNRGYEPISGPLYKGAPRAEFVATPTAELWARDIGLADEEFRVRLARSCLSAWYAEYYFRRCVADEAPEKPWLPEALQYAMLVHHEKLPDTKGLMSRPGQPRDLARERLIITNLARRVEVHPRGAAPDPVRAAFAEMSRG